MVKTTAVLIVCNVPVPCPSQSNVLAPIVVLADTVDVPAIRSVPVPVMEVGPASTDAAPSNSVPFTVTFEPDDSVAVPVDSCPPASTVTIPPTIFTASPPIVDVPVPLLCTVPAIVQTLATLSTDTSPLSTRLSVPP